MLPVRFWHARQWHIEMRTGLALARDTQLSAAACRAPDSHPTSLCVEQFAFALIEDDRHDQIFLIVEMAGKAFQQTLAFVGIALCRTAPRLVVALHPAEQPVRRIDYAANVAVDRLVIVFEHVEACTRRGSAARKTGK